MESPRKGTASALNFWVMCLSKGPVTWSTVKDGVTSKNVLEVSTEFPASVSANSLLTVSRAMKIGPDEDCKANPYIRLWSKVGFEPGFTKVKGRERNHSANLNQPKPHSNILLLLYKKKNIAKTVVVCL